MIIKTQTTTLPTRTHHLSPPRLCPLHAYNLTGFIHHHSENCFPNATLHDRRVCAQQGSPTDTTSSTLREPCEEQAHMAQQPVGHKQALQEGGWAASMA